MKDLKIMKIFVIVGILLQIVQGLPVDKWYNSEELSTIFIETETKYNWFEAWNECAMKNMSLIAVDTIEKNSALVEILRNKFGKTPQLWIGGHDNGEFDKFFWSSTGKRFEFTNWTKGNPDHSRKLEHCVHYYKATDFEWNDADCTNKMGFICEQNRFLITSRKDLAIKKNFIDQLFAL